MLLLQPPKSSKYGAPLPESRLVNIWERGGGVDHFKAPRYIRLLLKGDYMVIRLNDGRRMVIREDQRELPINNLATEMLQKFSDQTAAVVRGRAIVATTREIRTTNA